MIDSIAQNYTGYRDDLHSLGGSGALGCDLPLDFGAIFKVASKRGLSVKRLC